MISHKGTGIIRTERLILRHFTLDDAKSMFCNWASDDDVCRYMRWSSHKNEEETREVINRFLVSYDKESFYRWAITLKDTGEPIGSIGLMVVSENDLCGDIAYCIGKKYWGQGIGTEALKAVLKYGFEFIGFNRIEAYHSVNNPASGKVMEKSGMVLEGFAKQKYKSIFGFEDCNMYAIVKQDFEG
jgi:ribosomal-protein-alanine N-acetyltransferase